jgi:hypothetical protein
MPLCQYVSRFSVRQVLAAELSDIRAINFGGTGMRRPDCCTVSFALAHPDDRIAGTGG